MSNDDSRGLESPDRRYASTRTTRAGSEDGSQPSELRSDGGTTDSVRDRLETISKLSRSLLTDIRNPEATTDLEDIDEEVRRDVKRRLREIDAETRRVGLVLFSPNVVLSDLENDGDMPAVIRSDPVTTSHLGPEPGAFDRARETQNQRETHNSRHENESPDRTRDDPSQNLENTARDDNPEDADHDDGDCDGE